MHDGATTDHRCPGCGGFVTVLHMSCPNCDERLGLPAEVGGDV